MNTYSKVNNIAEYVNRPNIMYKNIKNTSVKVYHELRDLMVLIPQKCVEFTNQKVCYLYNTNEALR